MLICYLCAILAFKLEANNRVAWYIAAGVHKSGSVQYNTSSQFAKVGITLNGFGKRPDLYLLNTSPTLKINKKKTAINL